MSILLIIDGPLPDELIERSWPRVIDFARYKELIAACPVTKRSLPARELNWAEDVAVNTFQFELSFKRFWSVST